MDHSLGANLDPKKNYVLTIIYLHMYMSFWKSSLW